MAFLKKENSGDSGPNEQEIYDDLTNKNPRPQQSSGIPMEFQTPIDIEMLQQTGYPQDGQPGAAASSSAYLSQPPNFHLPFQIKTELDEANYWSSQPHRFVNPNEGDPQNTGQIVMLPKQNEIQNQNASLDLTAAYNNSLLYQNFQNPQSFAPVLNLELYGRHPTIAHSLFSMYSGGSNPNLPTQYFRPMEEQNADSFSIPKDVQNNALNLNYKTKGEAVQAYLRGNEQAIGRNEQDVILKNEIEQLKKKDLLQAQMLKGMGNRLSVNGESSGGTEHGESLPNDLSHRLENDKKNSLNVKDDGFLNTVYENIKSNLLMVQHENNFNKNVYYDDKNVVYEGSEMGDKKDGAPRDKYTNEDGSLVSNVELDDGKVIENSDGTPRGKFACGVCPYSCQSSAILKIHDRTHTGVKPFQCNFCEYKSCQKNNVAKHILVHMKEKPHQCQFCEYRCAQKNNLIVHVRTHTGEKPFVCTFCDYRTVQKPNLVKHMYLHTDEKPFACDVCNYKCVQKTNLVKHKQKHTSEKPFHCTDCGYKSSQKSNLTKHQLAHSKIKPWECDMCPYSCTQKCNLEKHRQAKHLQQLNANNFAEKVVYNEYEKVENYVVSNNINNVKVEIMKDENSSSSNYFPVVPNDS